MRAIIICGGNVGEYILDYIKDDDFVVCADSGYDSAVKFGIKPNIVIGDMDSVKSDYQSENIKVYPAKKDFTDSELAIKYAKECGYKELLLFGMIGTRMDHTFANISLLFSHNDIDLRIIDSNNTIYPVVDRINIRASAGDIISILPFSDDVFGVTTDGLYYSLKDASIKIGTTLGVSNVMTADECSIEIKKGKALVIRSKD